jgi:hypothetical protein
MRKLDRCQLKFWATNFPSESEAIATLTVNTGIGFYTLRRVFQGKREPERAEQAVLCEGTGLDLDTLFPVCEAKKESA